MILGLFSYLKYETSWFFSVVYKYLFAERIVFLKIFYLWYTWAACEQGFRIEVQEIKYELGLLKVGISP